MASIMFCTEIKVLVPVEQPKSATHIEFREAERVLMSKCLAIALLIFSLAASAASLYNTGGDYNFFNNPRN